MDTSVKAEGGKPAKADNVIAALLTDVTRVEGCRQGRLVAEADWCDDHWSVRRLGLRGGLKSVVNCHSLRDVLDVMEEVRASGICFYGDFPRRQS